MRRFQTLALLVAYLVHSRADTCTDTSNLIVAGFVSPTSLNDVYILQSQTCKSLPVYQNSAGFLVTASQAAGVSAWYITNSSFSCTDPNLVGATAFSNSPTSFSIGGGVVAGAQIGWGELGLETSYPSSSTTITVTCTSGSAHPTSPAPLPAGSAPPASPAPLPAGTPPSKSCALNSGIYVSGFLLSSTIMNGVYYETGATCRGVPTYANSAGGAITQLTVSPQPEWFIGNSSLLMCNTTSPVGAALYDSSGASSPGNVAQWLVELSDYTPPNLAYSQSLFGIPSVRTTCVAGGPALAPGLSTELSFPPAPSAPLSTNENSNVGVVTWTLRLTGFNVVESFQAYGRSNAARTAYAIANVLGVSADLIKAELQTFELVVTLQLPYANGDLFDSTQVAQAFQGLVSYTPHILSYSFVGIVGLNLVLGFDVPNKPSADQLRQSVLNAVLGGDLATTLTTVDTYGVELVSQEGGVVLLCSATLPTARAAAVANTLALSVTSGRMTSLFQKLYSARDTFVTFVYAPSVAFVPTLPRARVEENITLYVFIPCAAVFVVIVVAFGAMTAASTLRARQSTFDGELPAANEAVAAEVSKFGASSRRR